MASAAVAEESGDGDGVSEDDVGDDDDLALLQRYAPSCVASCAPGCWGAMSDDSHLACHRSSHGVQDVTRSSRRSKDTCMPPSIPDSRCPSRCSLVT